MCESINFIKELESKGRKRRGERGWWNEEAKMGEGKGGRRVEKMGGWQGGRGDRWENKNGMSVRSYLKLTLNSNEFDNKISNN